MNRRKPAKLAAQLDKNLLAYAIAAAAAGTGILAAAQPAQAEVVYTPKNEQISGDIFLDLTNSGHTDFTLQTFFGNTTNLFTQSLEVLTCNCSNKNAVAGTSAHRKPFADAYALAEGVQVGPGLQFVSTSQRVTVAARAVHKNNSSQVISTTFQGGFANGGKGSANHYLGFRFHINGEVHYGWARLTVSKMGTYVAYLHGYAYETVANKPIVTGFPHSDQASEGSESKPSATLGVLARGADGVKTWRMQQAAAK